ncbi:MAG: VWA domain-containing protein [Deltaproteobacteria bacterium]|nr:VWA domain-containing protein [Deltaproteobacteria bacterium]
MKKIILPLFLVVGALLCGCTDTTSHSRAVYMLMDTSGTYTAELKKAQAIINFLLGTLQPGDSLAVARIDTGSFSEKDIIQKVTFDGRPSMSNEQKRVFRQKIDDFVASVQASPYTDITGGVLQAVEYLNETGAGRKTILVFSDMEEDLQKGYVRDFPIQISGIDVVALNVTKLRQDIVDPRKYMSRLAEWEKRVNAGGGRWRVINDLERLERMLEG